MDKIIYEQPLNETIRICLRLELLFDQIDHHLHNITPLGTREIIALIINILNILDRPDLKSKLAKELNHHHTVLMRYGVVPDADQEKLQTLTKQLDELSRNLIDKSGKIGHRLRDTELLNTLRLHMASPGGGCSFDIPVYHYWLNLPVEVLKETVSDWLSDFAQIRTSVALMLDLVRKHGNGIDKTAIDGFHQELLDPQLNLRMIRIGVDKTIAAFPEISVGRHFLSVRFFNPTIERRPDQYSHDMKFWIAYCS